MPPAHPDREDPDMALVTGGEGDLARAIRAELESQGLTVLAPGRAELDVSAPESIAAYCGALSRLDLLVCNAGLVIDKPVATLGAEDFARVLEVNLSGAFRTARAALKLMARQRRGHLVFIGSFSALSGPAGQANYAAAKAGLIGLAQSLAREYGARNIRANCVLPGFLETKMTAPLNEAARDRIAQAHVLGRGNTPADAARFIRFLHLEMPHTSGQVFSLDSRPHPWT